MKWSARIVFDIYWGRRCIFSLAWILPFLRLLKRRQKHYIRSCFTKTRYKTEQAAKNAEWFTKRPDKLFGAYRCDMCDGWHITRPHDSKTLER